jgi:AcrR family transcriptional regulator
VTSQGTGAAKPGMTVPLEDFRTRTARQRRQRTSGRLLTAVFGIADAGSLDKMSVDDVRRAAGLSRGAFYNYFDTLSGLLIYMSGLIGTQINAEEDQLIAPTEDPVRDLAVHLRYFILRASSDRSCALLLRYALPITGAPSERMHNIVTAGFDRALACGGIDVPSVPAAVDLALGMLAAMLRRATLDGVDQRRIEDQTVIVLRALGVLGGRALTLAASPLPPLPPTPLRDAVLARADHTPPG